MRGAIFHHVIQPKRGSVHGHAELDTEELGRDADGSFVPFFRPDLQDRRSQLLLADSVEV